MISKAKKLSLFWLVVILAIILLLSATLSSQNPISSTIQAAEVTDIRLISEYTTESGKTVYIYSYKLNGQKKIFVSQSNSTSQVKTEVQNNQWQAAPDKPATKPKIPDVITDPDLTPDKKLNWKNQKGQPTNQSRHSR